MLDDGRRESRDGERSAAAVARGPQRQGVGESRSLPLQLPRSLKKLALKIDVDTFRGTREGVPRLVEVLQRHGVGATFLFSLGPDHTGRAIKRALRPGFMR